MSDWAIEVCGLRKHFNGQAARDGLDLVPLLLSSIAPPSLNIFQAISSGSPLITHAMPWIPILCAFTLG